MVAPLAPHLAEELWQRLGHPKSLAHGPFPAADAQYLVTDTVEYPVQVNGKVRGRITVAADADKASLEASCAGRREGAGVPGRCDPEEGHRGAGPAGQPRRLAPPERDKSGEKARVNTAEMSISTRDQRGRTTTWWMCASGGVAITSATIRATVSALRYFAGSYWPPS